MIYIYIYVRENHVKIIEIMIDIWEYIGHPDEMGDIWRFPKLEVPPNHPFLFGIVQYKPSSYWGTHILGDLYIDMDI